MTAGSIAVPTIVPLRAPNPYKSKNTIDSDTPIELKTETPNAEIFFTLDGSKPDPFAALGADRSTIKYTKPFRLREGKITVKAVALSRDGARESNVVTKNYDVEKPDRESSRHSTHHSKPNDFAFIDDLERERKKEIIKKRSILKKIVDTNSLSFRSDGGSLSDNESSRHHHHHHHSHPHRHTHNHGHRGSHGHDDDLNARLMKTATVTSFNEYGQLNSEVLPRHIVVPDSSVQMLRLQRETDFLRCIYCFAARPQDPMARFCAECGKNLPPIPQFKMATPENGKLGTCFFCKSTVPLNTTICVICENPIQPQLQPQAAIKLQGKVTCPSCFSQNPASYTTCLICEKKLPAGAKVHPVDLSVVVPQHPVPAGKSYTCSQCFRINRNDARFCDWCGAKPKKEIGPVQCSRCSVTNSPYAKFCSACGSIIQSGINQGSSASLFAKNPSQTAWLSHIESKANHILNKEYSTASTQTYGLYYASSKSLETKFDKDEKLMRMDREFLEKRPPLTAISAGKGYWRQQMDHICAHLKAFTHNNAEFRAVISEPKLGKISSANVDVDANWCTLTVTFPVRSTTGGKDSFNSSTQLEQSLRNKSHLSERDYNRMAAVVANRGSSLEEDSVTESDSYQSDSGKTKKVRKKRPTSSKYNDNLSGEDRQLLKEIGKNGRGRPHEVEILIKEGANPNAKTSDGLTAIFSAIRNRHYECVPVLVRHNADIKTRCPPRDNSVLHEAVLQGPEASFLLKMLIENGADPNWKNSKHETAFDLAVKENNTAAVNILNAHVGGTMIDAYLKTKSNDIKP